MSAIHPDESLARRMHGLQPGEQPPPRPTPVIPGTHDDGSLTEDPAVRAPYVLGDRSFADVTNIVCGYTEAKMPRIWLAALTVTSTIAAIGTGMILLPDHHGRRRLGAQQPGRLGVGHHQLRLLDRDRSRRDADLGDPVPAQTELAHGGQPQRRGDDDLRGHLRGIFPGIHVGRVWFAWFLFPIPNSNAIWPNFRSPLLWDVFAVSTYATVSLLFWYMGMIPDLATLRDRAYLRLSAGCRVRSRSRCRSGTT